MYRHNQNDLYSLLQWIKSTEAFVVEESVVDPVAGTMITKTKNLNHQKQMTVEEIQIYSKSNENSTW